MPESKPLDFRLFARSLPRVKPAEHIKHIHYIKDRYNNAYRIWCSWHFDDQFDMVPIEDFEPQVLKFVKSLPSIFAAGFPENDAGETECPLCKENRK